MKLSLFDSYHIRVRICPAVILLAPIAITLFCCFEKAFTAVSSSVILCVLLSIANILPIWQRKQQTRIPFVNYAAKALTPEDSILDPVTKKRYYRKLLAMQPEFQRFDRPDNSSEFISVCESAVVYLRNRSRENRLVQEENIHFGFYRNLILGKRTGIILSLLGSSISGVLLWAKWCTNICILEEISIMHCGVSLFLNLLLFLFWLMIKKDRLEEVGVYYAKALLRTIDTM